MKVKSNKEAGQQQPRIEKLNVSLCPITGNERTDDDHFNWYVFYLVLPKCTYLSTRTLQCPKREERQIRPLDREDAAKATLTAKVARST